MRDTMKTFLLGLCAVLLAITGTAQGADAVAGMAAKYEVKRKEIDQVRDKATIEALAEFKSLLDSLDKKYTAQGNLEGVIAVRKAKEYTVSPDVQIPDEAIPASGPLSEILKHYIQKKTQAEQTHSSSKVALTRAYLSALDRMKEGFTKQSKIEEAMTVSVEIERVTQAEPDLVAMVRSEAATTSPPDVSRTQGALLVKSQKPAGPIPGQPWTSPTGIEFVYIRPGTFMMGSPVTEQGRADDEQQHRVTLTKGYWLGKYEVAQQHWEALMGGNRSKSKGGNLPVENVSWEDCQQFIKKLCEKEGVRDGTYRLPTEAEWEYACRAGTMGPYAGDLEDMGWHGKNSGWKTHPLGQKKPNAWGLYDMHGNVWEWCADWFDAYPSAAVTDPSGPRSGSLRVLRGGGWSRPALAGRSAFRNRDKPSIYYDNLGLRLLRTE
jgi:formylglycine-generating enzyme required for sulfatase activity